MLSRWLVVLVVSFSLFSKGLSLTLDELIEEGYRRSHSIRSSEFKLEASEKDVDKALSSFLPTVEFKSAYSRTEKLPELTVGSGPFAQKVPFGFKDNYQNTLGLNYIIFAGGLRLDAYKISKNMVKVNALEIERLKNETRNRIELAYYGYKLAESSLAIAESSLARAREHYNVTLEQFNAGRVPSLSVEQSELAVAQAEQKLKESQHQLELARLALNIAVGFPADTTIAVDGALEFTPLNITLDSLLDVAFRNRPELISLKYYAEITSISKDMALKQYLPKLGLNLTYSYNKPFYFENEYKSNFTTTVFLSIPIFDGLSNKWEYEKAKAELEGIRQNEQLLRQAIEFEVRSNYVEVQNAALSVELSKKSLDLARSAYKTAEEQYANGFISNIEYKDAELQYTQAEFGYIFSVYRYLVAYSNLMKASCFYNIKEE